MSASATPLPLPSGERPPSPEQTLRRLFLTLFLRGRSSCGLQKETAPKSIGQKLTLTLALYALIGLLSLSLLRQPVFVLSVYLHAMTFIFLGMFVASSAGEILFNKEEADILLHRPLTPRAMLWAKVRVLVEVSLWLAVALNLVGFLVGLAAPDGGPRFVLAHAVSITLEAMFCTGSVVMVYQLCLRWLGRERLEGLMTTAQVVVSVAAVLGGQLLPQFVVRANGLVGVETSWWIALFPPAWFAGIDDALGGSGALGSWRLAAVGIIATALVLWFAFGKLAHDYHTGLQTLQEAVSPVRKWNRRRWMDSLVDLPPLRWWLRDPVARASFLLTAAYLVRDRDVKLRVYPGIAPMLVMPLVLLMRDFGKGGFGGSPFGIAWIGGFLGLIPLLAISMLQYSQQWRAADIFRAAPISGPAPLCNGARRAVLCCLTLPALAVFTLIAWLVNRESSLLLLLLPGIIGLPVYALIPNLAGRVVPLSLPADEAKAAGRTLSMIAITFVAVGLSGIASWSWSAGWFWWFVLIEATVAAVLYMLMRASLTRAGWRPLE